MEKEKAKRYEKAKKFLPQNVAGLLKNVQPSIAWSPDEKRICYRHDTIQGYEYLIFNLQNKKKESAFDHSLLARKVAEKLNREVIASALPINKIDFVDEHILQLHMEQFIFQYDRTTQVLSLVPEIKKPSGDVSMSHDHGALGPFTHFHCAKNSLTGSVLGYIQ